MTTICHVLDRSCGWAQRLGLTFLLDRLPSDQYASRLFSIDVQARTLLPDRAPAAMCPRAAVPGLGGFPLLWKRIEEGACDVLHAWGTAAARACFWPALRNRPLVVTLHDPALSAWEIKQLRKLAKAAFVCTSGLVRRRLVEGGVAAAQCVVVRPGVDFGLIRAARRSGLREELGIAPQDRVVMLPVPPSQSGRQIEAVLAVLIVNLLQGGWRVVLGGESPERERIVRYIAGLPHTHGALVPAPPETAFERLMAIADVLIVADQGDTDTTAIASAMACGALIVGAATPSVAELIAHKVNGLLFKPSSVRINALAMARLLAHDSDWHRLREAARGQAYEVFSVTRCVEQYQQVYHNAAAGRDAAADIEDPAMV